ncbi:hypothetical protein [Siminovitchia sp. 179-K 8D1 HS]|uniref:hypothetical protein n=1 Tax=Siminovitchia sp. 179-K 8D1 HS TaxID=3142385 RepID=UPI0039A2FA72
MCEPSKRTDMIIDVLKSNKGYIFTLPSLGYNSNKYYKVNGEKVEAGRTYTTETEPAIEIYSTHSVKVKAKSLNNELPDLSIDEYEKEKERLESKKEWDSYGEYKIFKDLEDEYKYKKFLRDYEIITKKDEEYVQTLQLNIIKKLESDNSFITLHRHMGKEITSQAATYDRWGFYKHYIRKYLRDQGFEDESDSFSNSGKGTFKLYEYHQGMVNLFIEGKQLFDIKVHSFSDELDIVEKKYEEDKAWIEDKINNYIRNSYQLPSVQDVISKMKRILGFVQSIDSKVKTYDDYNAAIREIKSFIADLEAGKYSK